MSPTHTVSFEVGTIGPLCPVRKQAPRGQGPEPPPAQTHPPSPRPLLLPGLFSTSPPAPPTLPFSVAKGIFYFF